MVIREITILAHKFRRVLDSVYQDGAFGRMSPFCKFPCGCCDDTCDLFGQMLIDYGIPVWRVVGTYRYDDWEHKYTHAWLQLDDGTIIDLTGDQYRNNPILLNYDIPCYVGRVDQFHQLFETETPFPFYGLNNYPEETAFRLQELYKIVTKYF